MDFEEFGLGPGKTPRQPEGCVWALSRTRLDRGWQRLGQREELSISSKKEMWKY